MKANLLLLFYPAAYISNKWDKEYKIPVKGKMNTPVSGKRGKHPFYVSMEITEKGKQEKRRAKKNYTQCDSY